MLEYFPHDGYVTCVSFSPTDKYKFVSGCLDEKVRIWNIRSILDKNSIILSQEIDDKKITESPLKKGIKDKNNLYLQNYLCIQGSITAISFYPTGDKLAIGTHKGNVIVYEIKGNKQSYKGSFSCKNRIGKKITSIEFINKNEAIISTCDSRIRHLSMNDGTIIHKYKGFVNEESMIKFCIDYTSDIILTGSDNGYCYVWDINWAQRKNSTYEYFIPYPKHLVHCSLIVPEKCYCNYLKKIMKITNKLLITSIIINATNHGTLEILLNIDDK